MRHPAVEQSSYGAWNAAGVVALFLALLLVGDLVYIAVHLVWTQTGLLNSPLAALDVDRGYAEFFQYMKLLWTIILLTCLFLRTRMVGLLAWALLFAYLLVDDSFSLHENLGQMLAGRLAFGDAIGLRAVDFGELLVSAIAGAVLFVVIAWAYRRGSSEFRRTSRHLLALLLAIVFFGVVVDMVHIVLDPTSWLDQVLLILEDGGELVVMSFITWYVFLRLVARESSNDASLVDLVSGLPAHVMRAFRLRR